ncbi:MAG: hypothetical protein U0X20_07490 [Caldilineaceae bacterium]
MDALLDALVAVIGLSALAVIGLRYPRSRMFAAPLAIIWTTFWKMQAAQATGVSNRVHLLIVAIIAAAVATVIAVTIPYTIEDRRRKQARRDA